MPRVEAVSEHRIRPAREARRLQETRVASGSIQRRADEARQESLRRAAEELRRRPVSGPGADLDVLA